MNPNSVIQKHSSEIRHIGSLYIARCEVGIFGKAIDKDKDGVETIPEICKTVYCLLALHSDKSPSRPSRTYRLTSA